MMRNPFGELGRSVSDSELRETAYEILIGACHSSVGSKPLTCTSQSEDNMSLSSSNGEESATSASKVKKALGLKPSKRDGGERKSRSVDEMIRVQMRVSESTDSNLRQALLRIGVGQLGQRMESMVLPLELLQQFNSSHFPNQQEFEEFQNRNLKILEVGLLLHPHIPLDKSDASAQWLKKIIHGASEKPLETERNESMQLLRTVVMSLACRSYNNMSSTTCHWADGFPFNLYLYQMLLEACFDIDDETSIIDEVDELLELIKTTWVVLGIDEALHNVCFVWVLFHHYVKTGETKDDLLSAVSNLLSEIENDAETRKESDYSKILSSTLGELLGWTEKRLLTYHDTFNSDNIQLMEIVASVSITSAKIVVEDISHEYQNRKDVVRDRVETYIRSSIRSAFAQKMENNNLSKEASNHHQNTISVLSYLAQEVPELALTERDIYSPILKKWHPLAAGIAVATLHSCYSDELKQFVAQIKELTPDAVQVLLASDRLEKQLVQIAVESDDGRKSVISEMPPYEVETMIATLVNSWIVMRLNRLRQLIDRNFSQEKWKANKEGVAPSAYEVLRFVDETLEALFLLPIPVQQAMVIGLVAGLDSRLAFYTTMAKFHTSTRDDYIPTLPALTRCSGGSKFFKKFQPHMRRKSQVKNANLDKNSLFSQLCVLNSMHRINSEANTLSKKTVTYLRNAGFEVDEDKYGIKFKLTISGSFECTQQIYESIGYAAVFHELRHVLWDGLYADDVLSSRIEPFLQELERKLKAIATTVHDQMRTRVITEVMKASFDGYLLVLLAGGPSRAFTQQDSSMIKEDFKLLCNLFASNGGGLPRKLIDELSGSVKAILPLLSMNSEDLIKKFKQITIDTYGSSSQSRLSLPPTTRKWNPNEPNTLLRVLCHRDDEIAAKFLKRTFNLPTTLNS